jgi:hypothetical protein
LHSAPSLSATKRTIKVHYYFHISAVTATGNDMLNLLMFTGEFLPKWMPCVAKSMKTSTFHIQ